MTDQLLAMASFDSAPAGQAAELLRPCCASQRWLAELVAGRPYHSLASLTAASMAAIAGLDQAELGQALAAHPRIGERAAGSDREAGWSRQEQSGVIDQEQSGVAAQEVPAQLRAELAAGNLAYERRFGQVFLVCATGRDTAELLRALTERLANDPVTEREVVRGELAKIVNLRLAKTFAVAD